MFKDREAKWQKKWADAKAFVPKNDNSGPKYYTLIEFPFPSGTGLHAGHMLGQTGMDIIARYKRKKGFDVLYPVGFDSLGISAEQYATKIGQHPAIVVEDLKKKFIQSMNGMGWSIDPESHIATSDPEFIKWTQWMFIQFFNFGLAYKSKQPMNWCPNCKTTLTNEELENGNCDRCHGPVETRMKMQWNLAITKYADRLIDDLKLVDYPEHVKTAQINWIGRSYGAEVDFAVGEDAMTVFTTRVDTIFGATFCVISPEHKLLRKWLDSGQITNAAEVEKYILDAAAKDEFARTDMTKEKTGVELKGIKALNPFNNKEIPIFAADYVLANYGFGAIMAVPAHDQRDYDFAKKFGLDVIQVIEGGDALPYEGDGLHINSEYLNGLNKEDAIKKATEMGKGFARSAKQYKLKDWGFSRQMYWGEPIPLVHCEHCGWVPVPDDQLPLLQPHMEDYKPTDDGESPLARATDWVNTTCPKCGGHAVRETDTMPQWAGSSWYYMRYLDPKNDKEFCSRAQLEKWMPVDHYNGGNEHTTRHLLYSRFWYKALFDLGFVPAPEPYKKRTTNGVVLGNDGKKMSKSRGNGFLVNDLLEKFGADAARLTILSLGPWSDNMIWSEGTLAGVQRFLKRVENLSENISDAPLTPEQERLMNQLIKDVSERIENMQFNTAISAMMSYINEFNNGIPRANYEVLLQCLNPFAPHLTEEMWEKLGHTDMLVFAAFPKADESKLQKSVQTVVVSTNGKRRAEIDVAVAAAEEEIIAAAKVAAEKYLAGELVKTIFVPGKMVNFVVK
ncbi:MAG: leucine--tRNA ligase [Rickettsiales bacterium]|jgi:leucyl-tRNA synthetase|nr:leucine--tRNA ligase [Rickettsiales bacterium]